MSDEDGPELQVRELTVLAESGCGHRKVAIRCGA